MIVCIRYSLYLSYNIERRACSQYTQLHRIRESDVQEVKRPLLHCPSLKPLEKRSANPRALKYYNLLRIMHAYIYRCVMSSGSLARAVPI